MRAYVLFFRINMASDNQKGLPSADGHGDDTKEDVQDGDGKSEFKEQADVKATPSKGKRLLDSLSSTGKASSNTEEEGRAMRKKPRVDYDENKKPEVKPTGTEHPSKTEDDDDEIQEITPPEVKAKATISGSSSSH